MGSAQHFIPLTMDWREYIQEREHFAEPQRGHLAALLAAMHARPGATRPDAELRRQEEEAVNAASAAARQMRHVEVAQMSFEEYLAFRNRSSHEAAHSF